LVNPGHAIATLTVLLLTISASIGGAQENQPTDKLIEGQYSMVGLRLGFWADMGKDDLTPDVSVDADLPDAGFYTEFFIDYRLLKPLMLEISAGIASRGDIVIRESDDRYIGTINLYPLLLQLKLMPLVGHWRTIQPFVLGGGGVVWGRQNIEFISSADPYFNPDITTRTEADFVGVVGGGFEIALSEQLGMNITSKYHPVEFGSSIGGVRDFTGLSFSIGVAYFLHKK
jgi:hypothetical protein